MFAQGSSCLATLGLSDFYPFRMAGEPALGRAKIIRL